MNPAQKPTESQKRKNASIKGKKRAHGRGVDACEYERCRLKVHPVFGRMLPLLIHHHVIPWKYKGTYPGDINGDEVTVILCPNHAAIADCISGTHTNGPKDFRLYCGPKTREELLKNLRLIEENPEAWASTYWKN